MWPLETVNFTDADLKANREGRLTDVQRQRLEAKVKEKRRVAWIWIVTAAFVIGLIVLSILGIAYGRVRGDLSIFLSPERRPAVFGVILVGLLIFVAVWARLWGSVWAYSKGHVRSASALCEVVHRPYGKDESKAVYILNIKNKLIGTTRAYLEDVDSLHDGRHYRVYYLKDNPLMILSWDEMVDS